MIPDAARLLGLRWAAALMHGVGDPMVVGLAYHGVVDEPKGGLENLFEKHIDRKRFEEHLKFIGRSFRVVDLDEVARKIRGGERLTRKSVFITFDDGYRGCHDVAFPLLKKYGMPATFFVPTSYVDSGELLPLDRLDSAIAHAGAKRVTVDAGGGARVSLEMGSAGQRQKSAVQLHRIYKGLEGEGRSALVDGVAAALGYASRRDVPPLGEHMRLMAWEQLAGMSREGMSIGSHTHSHVIMTRIGREEAEFELAESKRLIEKATGRDCRVFCYPNGRYGHDGNAATDRLVEKAGYEGSVYMQGGINTGRSRPYSLARYAVGAGTSLRDLANHLASIWPRLEAIASRSRN